MTHDYQTLLRGLEQGLFLDRLGALYGSMRAGSAQRRALRLTRQLRQVFSPDAAAPAGLFSGPGRTEIGGNHTDHQHGRVLCASVDLDVLACAAENGTRLIRVESEGYPRLELSLDALSPRPEEQGTSAALIRGVAAGLSERGCKLRGVDVCMDSSVPPGSGLSSSAAFEILFCQLLSAFATGEAPSPVEAAKLSQRAENLWFGKPCGLMDQMASAVGGAVFIDFRDPEAPLIRSIDAGSVLADCALCIVDTRSGHEDLTQDYAAIPAEMGAVAAYFGKRVLREVPEDAFLAELKEIRARCGDRAVLRALHFFEEDRRAEQEAQALEANDARRFLSLVNASGLSSELALQNVWTPRLPQTQPVAVALALGRRLLRGEGAIRVHGGGFAGTIQAFVPKDLLDAFRAGMERLLGDGACRVLQIRPEGGCRVI